MKGKLKQTSKKKKNAVLQKYKMSVDEFIKGRSQEIEADQGLRCVKKKSRKELRKEMRKMKKAKMKSHYEGKKFSSLLAGEGENMVAPAAKKPKKRNGKTNKEVAEVQSSKASSAPAEKPESAKSSAKAGKKKVNRLQESRKMALLEANEDEDREIKKLERFLGMNKRKNKKSLPQSFVADGLDYILGVLDAGSSAFDAYDEDDDMDLAKEKFEKLDESDSQLSDMEEEPEDEMASEGSDEDENDLVEEGDDDDEVEESDHDDENDEEEMEDEQDEGDVVGSEDESEEEVDTADRTTPDSSIENVRGYFFFFYKNVELSSLLKKKSSRLLQPSGQLSCRKVCSSSPANGQ